MLWFFFYKYWQRIKKPEAKWPVGRFWNAGSIINTRSGSPMLVISGGLDENAETLDDCWIFNITEHSCTKV